MCCGLRLYGSVGFALSCRLIAGPWVTTDLINIGRPRLARQETLDGRARIETIGDPLAPRRGRPFGEFLPQAHDAV